MRPATADDITACADLYLAARRAAVPDIPPLVHDEDSVHDWMSHLVRQPSETWLAENGGGDAVGLLVIGNVAVDQLYVDPEHTGRQIGSRLLGLAKLRRPDGLDLWVFQSNIRAIRFYERHGFVEVERTDGAANEERAPDLRMAWNP